MGQRGELRHVLRKGFPGDRALDGPRLPITSGFSGLGSKVSRCGMPPFIIRRMQLSAVAADPCAQPRPPQAAAALTPKVALARCSTNCLRAIG